jgi:Aerotolerance regulator N-terminal/von Willebrand factor type A domain
VSWLLPGFLAGAALIGLPFLLHFLRSKPKVTVLFPSLRFLEVTAIRDTRRHRLQRWVTLLLRCLVILAIAAAFARPFFKDAVAERRHVMVIAVDNSMSMQTRGRWEAWRQRALDELQTLGPGDQAALLVMFPRPAWLVPLTEDLDRVRTALMATEPGYETTRYAPALAMAAETLSKTAAADRTLVWVADEQRTGWSGVDLTQPLPAGIQLRLGNAAPLPARQSVLTRVRATPGATQITATVRLDAPERDTREIVVRDGARVLARQMVKLKFGDNAVVLPLPVETNPAFCEVSLDPDDLPADDTAWVVREAKAGNKVLLDAAPGADFLTHALRATQKLDANSLEPAVLPTGAWPIETPVLLRGSAAFQPPLLDELERFVSAGGAGWIFVNGSPEQIAWLAKHDIQITPRAQPEEPWHLRDWDTSHPILAAYEGQNLLPLLDVEFSEGFDLDGDALTPLANWPDGQVALAEWSGGGHRLLIAGFPPTREATNWPTRASFVPFTHQAVRWLGTFVTARQNWQVGDTIPLQAGEGKWRALAGPGGKDARPATGGIRADMPGIYEFSTDSQRKLYAVNPPLEESNLAPWPKPAQLLALAGQALPETPPVAVTLPPSPQNDETSESQQRLWWWVLAACGILMLAELALANRTAL